MCAIVVLVRDVSIGLTKYLSDRVSSSATPFLTANLMGQRMWFSPCTTSMSYCRFSGRAPSVPACRYLPTKDTLRTPSSPTFEVVVMSVSPELRSLSSTVAAPTGIWRNSMLRFCSASFLEVVRNSLSVS